jgi:hypothetical protein
MIRVSKTFTRQNANTAWWFQTSEGADYAAYRLATYGSKLSEPTNELSPDQLTWRYSVIWASQADYNEMMADPIITSSMESRKIYDSQNGITSTSPQLQNI